MKMTYAEQLRHPNWQKRRLEMLSAAGWQCQKCGEKEKMLQVHHKQYFKGRKAWEYEDSDLLVLCEPCHEKEHTSGDALKSILARADAIPPLPLLAGAYAWDEGLPAPAVIEAFAADRHVFLAGCIARICAEFLDTDQAMEVGRLAIKLSSDKQRVIDHCERMEKLLGATR